MMKQTILFILILILVVFGLILVLAEMEVFNILLFIGVKIVGLIALTVGYILGKNYLD